MLNISGNEIKIEVQKEWYSKEQCKLNPNKLYIFGDNTLRRGQGGQAQIRYCNNSFGIATKWNAGYDIQGNPTFDRQFFNDIDMFKIQEILNQDINNLKVYVRHSSIIDTVVFPYDGLGTGLSRLPQKAPNCYHYLVQRIINEFNVKGDNYARI